MDTTTVTSKGQVTIPQSLRRELGIRRGSKIAFEIVDDHVEMRVIHSSTPVSASGFGMLRSKKPAVPADLDPAELVQP
ncbi:MAG: AbrB/MazE/SpoVT family DNA-binding domain-containing protein [Rhodocyclaceae bacterium]|jgi:AbrB family looped-hinge helix DNA binding protein|nr:AbrB/MazE/SpoVT family DNA-binding domain-containing protein [Rhodocyclaceae bacterium]